MSGLMFPKGQPKKKRKTHGKSILQPKEDKRCYLCMKLHGDYRIQRVQEHHIVFGRAGREKSEEMGLKVNLCIHHHEIGEEAVHNNNAMARILQADAQEAYELKYGHEKWIKEIRRNYYLDTSL